jgi:hypothetical protein
MYLREEIARALQRPLPAARKTREVGAVVHELLAFLGGQEFADTMSDKVTQGIVRAAPRTASFTTIDPQVHNAIDVQIRAALRSVSNAEEGLTDLKHTMYPPTVRELDEIKGSLGAATLNVDAARAMVSRVASRHVRAFYDPGQKSDTGYMPGNVHQEAPYRGVGSQVPEPRDRDGKLTRVPQYGMMKIPGYEWHNTSAEFHKTAGGVKRLLEDIGAKAEKLDPRFDLSNEDAFEHLMMWAETEKPSTFLLRNSEMAAQSFLNWQRTNRP